MGLAAGQARLLSITRRKSDCEFLSMQYSHQKLAISRELEMLSNNYSNSLNKTKLLYDFYGSNSAANSYDLNYGLMMKPSALNDYIPRMVTTNSGKVVLDGKYAAAARAAGIPPEGLATGSLPSDTVRNQFIAALQGQNLISSQQAENIQQIPYNQALGLGAVDTVTYETAYMNYDQLIETLSQPQYRISLNDGVKANKVDFAHICKITSNGNEETLDSEFTLGDILSGNLVLGWEYRNNENAFGNPDDDELDDMVKEDAIRFTRSLTCWEDIIGTIDDVLGNDPYSITALNYAKDKMNLDSFGRYMGDYNCRYYSISGGGDRDDGSAPPNTSSWFGTLASNLWTGNKVDNGEVVKYAVDCYVNNANCDFTNLNAFGNDNQGTWGRQSNRCSGAAIGISVFAKTYLAYIIEYLQGLNNATIHGADVRANNDAGLSNVNIEFPVGVTSNVEVADQKLGGFYDTLFNQICTRGWTQNNNINDKDYMQNMLKSGAMFICSESTDGYFYQENYASNVLIREEEDTSAVAEAEAKYNAQKQRLANKEDAIDLKMKNLDTELTALQTEYDSVKKTIDKNISNSFKRYS